MCDSKNDLRSFEGEKKKVNEKSTTKRNHQSVIKWNNVQDRQKLKGK